MSSYSPLRSSSPLLQSHSILQTQNQTQKFKKTKLLILLNLIITSFLIFIWYLFQPKPSTSQSPSLLHSTQPKLTLSDNLSQILSVIIYIILSFIPFFWGGYRTATGRIILCIPQRLMFKSFLQTCLSIYDWI